MQRMGMWKSNKCPRQKQGLGMVPKDKLQRKQCLQSSILQCVSMRHRIVEGREGNHAKFMGRLAVLGSACPSGAAPASFA